ncbi:MAG: hypothetical protein A2Y38_07645 [Spirochaetes bacterium GWB1_59_5]|nr:MAG: hypothetical protein A2Y38_07645 [Spirochaetes bacterium GWB1_59_5]
MKAVAFLMLCAVGLISCGATLSVRITPPVLYDDLDDCSVSNDVTPLPPDSLGVTVAEYSTAGAAGPWVAWDSRTATAPYTISKSMPMGVYWVQVTSKSKSGVGCPVVISKQATGGKPSRVSVQ